VKVGGFASDFGIHGDMGRETRRALIRRLLIVVAAIAMPIGIVTASSSTAGAKGSKPPPDPPVTCTVSANVNFASPGISNPGSISSSKESTTTTSDETFGGAGCTGSGPNLAITSKSVKCDKHTPGEPSSNPACEPGFYGYNSWNNYETTGTASLGKATKKLSFTINGIAYSTKTSSFGAVACADSEVGFKVTGAVSAPKQDKGQSAVLTACLGATTGSGTSPACEANFASCIGAAGTVASAAIDPATSSLAIDE
jgi:hypothetical protein